MFDWTFEFAKLFLLSSISPNSQVRSMTNYNLHYLHIPKIGNIYIHDPILCSIFVQQTLDVLNSHIVNLLRFYWFYWVKIVIFSRYTNKTHHKIEIFWALSKSEFVIPSEWPEVAIFHPKNATNFGYLSTTLQKFWAIFCQIAEVYAKILIVIFWHNLVALNSEYHVCTMSKPSFLNRKDAKPASL